MARTAQVTDGTTTIDVINASGIEALKDGFGGYEFSPHQYDQAGGLESRLFTESWRLLVHGSSHNNAASQSQTFIRLLRQAWLHHKYPRKYAPVYLKVQTDDETNPRYALVYEAPAVRHPDFFGNVFTRHDIVTDFGMTIVRSIFRSGIPGSLGSALALTPTDGPSSPTKVHVSNHRDDVNITHIFVKDNSGGPSYSANRHGATSWNLFPSTIGNGDWLGFCSTDNMPKSIVIPKLSVAGSITTSTFSLSYYNGSWIDLVLGTDYTCYPGPTIQDCLEQNDEDIVINILGVDDAQATLVNGVTGVWLLVKEDHASPVYPTTPVASASQVDYAQRTPNISIPATAIDGDVPPYLCLRLHTPAGGDDDEGFANLSRIVMGLKTSPGAFTPYLNCGGDDNPSGWAVSYGTDASAVADPSSPGGKHCAVSFSSDGTLVPRVTFTGTAKLADWIGIYKMSARVIQTGGSAGDTSMKVRTFLHESNDYSPKFDSPEVTLKGVDQGPEVVDFGILNLAGETVNADSFTGANLIFEILGARSGAGTLEILDFILIPVDEWSAQLKDPLEDATYGSSALRGGVVVDMDGGILANRMVKYIRSGSNLYPVGSWGRGGPPIKIDPGEAGEIYFLMMHYPAGGTWGIGPLIGSLGCSISAELFGQNCYLGLRGSD